MSTTSCPRGARDGGGGICIEAVTLAGTGAQCKCVRECRPVAAALGSWG